MTNPLLDRQFLYELTQYKHKEIYAKIISLTFDEQPLEQIEGRITGGSVNVDGKSVVRRTCNLSLIAKEVNITDFYWGVSNKFTLEIGVKNFINSDYPDIIWFKQGIFVITSFSSSLSGNNYSISINGKDKMCLLNGDIGGNLPASIDFGKIENYTDDYSVITFEDKTQYEANKYYTKNGEEYIISTEEYNSANTYYKKETVMSFEDIKVKDIVREAVHFYGKEPYGNIIINDLDDTGLELLEYRGDTPIYLFYNVEQGIYDQMTADQDFKVNGQSISELKYNAAIEDFESGTKYTINNITYTITKIEYGQTAGYRITNLTYAGEIISKPGETLTSILDKIIKMLGIFEYFYDINGKFVFQRKKIYNQMSWTSMIDVDNGNVSVQDAVNSTEFSYSFTDMNLIQKFTNTPAINNVKNDYSVWGVRKTASDAEIPIHARYAIQRKPDYYKAYDGTVYCTERGAELGVSSSKVVDWREIIYQMAVDYYAHNQEENFLQNIKQNNSNVFEIDGKSINLYPTGETGYEIFYTDIQGFWRQLYNPDPPQKEETTGGEYVTDKMYKVLDLTQEEYQKNSGSYYILDEKTNEYKKAEKWEEGKTYYTNNSSLGSEQFYVETVVWNPFTVVSTSTDFYGENEQYKYWHKDVINAPEKLNFWMDFYEGDDSLSQYSISNIGDRTKVVENSKITSVYYKKVPDVIFTTKDEYATGEIKTGYTYIQLNTNLENLFTISAQGKSAREEINDLFNQHSYCTENVSVTVIPIYNLEPNTLIYLYNNEIGINGKYQIEKLTIPLAYNGMMSITASKVFNDIY